MYVENQPLSLQIAPALFARVSRARLACVSRARLACVSRASVRLARVSVSVYVSGSVSVSVCVSVSVFVSVSVSVSVSVAVSVSLSLSIYLCVCPKARLKICRGCVMLGTRRIICAHHTGVQDIDQGVSLRTISGNTRFFVIRCVCSGPSAFPRFACRFKQITSITSI